MRKHEKWAPAIKITADKYCVSTVFVKAFFDIDCQWEGIPPIYRVYFAGELFTERTWIWSDQYLTEMLQIQAPPGLYDVIIESVGPLPVTFQLRNHRIEDGPARWLDHNRLEILHAGP